MTKNDNGCNFSEFRTIPTEGYDDHLKKSEKMIQSKAFQKWDRLVQDCFKKMTEEEIDELEEFGIRSSYGRYPDEQ